MKKFILLIVASFLLAGCGNGESEKDNDIRNEVVSNVNENIDTLFATESFTDVWHIEDYVIDGEYLDDDRLFRFTDTYIMDEEMFESLNDYEKGLAMKTSIMITKSIRGRYDEDKDLFEKDLDEYYDILENGDESFID